MKLAIIILTLLTLAGCSASFYRSEGCSCNGTIIAKEFKDVATSKYYVSQPCESGVKYWYFFGDPATYEPGDMLHFSAVDIGSQVDSAYWKRK